MSTTASETLLNHWIGGKRDERSAERHGEVTDPATGEVVARVPFATAQDVDRAVQAAAEAAKTWGAASLTKRAQVMFAFRELVNAHKDELAALITREHGKVLADARGEVTRGLEVIEFACGLGHLLKGENTPQVSGGVDSHSMRMPLGVVAGITPFNFPVMVPLWMAPVALACGNAFILKPSEQDPSPSVRLAELLAEAGLPDGVFSVVHGDKEAVDAILEHPGIAGVSFVGSTPVAQYIYETGTANGKRVQALGGAKNHAVVLPDADLDFATQAIIGAGYGSAGERCMAISAIVAVGDVGGPLVDRLAARARSVTLGPGNTDVEMGPVITCAARDRITGLIDRGLAEGAKLVVDGRRPSIDGHPNGFYVGATLFDDVTPQMTIYREEIFGPVLCVLHAESLEDAIAMVNGNPYANGAAIFTRSGYAARHFEQAVEVGMAGINVPVPVPMAFYSFGGWRNSLFGDLNVHGMDGVRFYTRGKTVTSRWPDDGSAAPGFHMPVMG
jgi:malonate-semialdehyde dehydrogenase (acetylating)/methylmalonate-semialdehyde dehydrogenase